MNNNEILVYNKLTNQEVSVTGEVEIKNDSGNPVPISGTVNTGLTQPLTDAQLRATPVPISGTVIIGQSAIGNFGIDAGGRTRVAQITTLLDGKILGADDSFLFENAGTGSATYANNKVNLSVTAGQYIIRQSKRFCPYFSGKVQLVEGTFDNFQTEANTTKRVGYFSSSAVAPHTANFDGFFLEDDGTSKSLKAYRDGTLTIDVPFTSMDNYALVSSYDWSKFTVIAFDFLWLGGAVLRFWLKTSLGFVLVHTVNYSGTATDTFILSPNQPLRYEVRSTTGTGSLRYICSQVATEGSLDEAGKTLGILNYTSCATNVVGTIYAIKGLKKQVAYRDTAVQILDMSVAITASTDSGVILLIQNPTLSALLAYTNNSRIQDGSPTNPAAPPTVTAGTGRVLAALPINTGSTTSSVMKENFLSFLSTTITNGTDEYVLAYMPTTNNQTVNGVLNIKEF